MHGAATLQAVDSFFLRNKHDTFCHLGFQTIGATWPRIIMPVIWAWSLGGSGHHLPPSLSPHLSFQHPYPTEDEKRQIAAQTNLTLLQVNNW